MADFGLGTVGGEVLSGIAPTLIKRLGVGWTKVTWPFAEDEYRKRVVNMLIKTRLLGNAHDIDIENVFTDAFFLPEPSATRRYQSENPEAIGPDELSTLSDAKRLSADAVAAQEMRLYILGTPGSGKSTFLKHIAILAAKRRIPGLPIFIPMKEWADSKTDLMDFAAHQFDFCGFPDAKPVVEALLAAGSVILLLDGLDEVPETDGIRSRTIQTVVELSRKYPSTKIFLTCRTATNEHSFSHFRYVEMADFTDEQQVTFVRKWHGAKIESLDRFLKEFQRPSSEGLRDIARKPLLLALMCIAFDMLQGFPRNKSSLYEEATDVLLTKWDASRSIVRESYGIIGLTRKKQFLGQLALQTFRKRQYAFNEIQVESVLQNFLKRIPIAEQTEEIGIEKLFRSLESSHGILVERSSKLFSFSHLSVHEYFAALGLSYEVSSGRQWSELLPMQEVFSDRWREVAVNIAGMIGDADNFLRHIQMSIDECLLQRPRVKALVSSVAILARDTQAMHALGRDHVDYLKRASTYQPTQPFYPSDGLSRMVNGLELILLKLMTQQKKITPNERSEFGEGWARITALREILSYKHGVELRIGPFGDYATFEEELMYYLATQDLYLAILDVCLVQDRVAARRRILN